MTRLAGKIPFIWSLLAFIAVFLSITGLVIFQLFTDQFQRPLSLREFLHPQTWKQMLKSLPRTKTVDTEKIFWWQEGELYQGLMNPKPVGKVEFNPETTLFFLSPEKDKLAWIQEQNELIILELASGQILKKQQLSNSVQSQIIHWGKDNQSIYIAQKNESWSIAKMVGETQTVLKTNITYAHMLLTQASRPISRYLIYPDCTEICRFGKLDVTTGEANFIPALKENDPNARLEDLLLHFYDEDKKLIAYQRTPGSEPLNFFVINFEKELIQMIQLILPSGRELSFVGYYPQSQEMAFVSREDNKQELLVYIVNQPALKLLGPIPGDSLPRVLPVNNMYVVNNQELRSIFQITFKEELDHKIPVTVL